MLVGPAFRFEGGESDRLLVRPAVPAVALVLDHQEEVVEAFVRYLIDRRDGEYGVARTSVLELQGQAPCQV